MRGAALLGLAGCAALSVCAWAGNALPVPGIPNFHQVNDHIYRGAQPANEAWPGLANLGIKTVVDLRPCLEHSCKDERHAVEAVGMRYVNMPLSGMRAPSNDAISKLLVLLDAPSGPVFLHCRRGADRTGTVIACYRIAHDRWSNRKALAEAQSDGMSWMEFGMKSFVLGFHAPPAAQPQPATLN